MYPYWVFGLLMFVTVFFSSHRSLLKIDWKAVLRWGIIVVSITVIRFFIIKLTASPDDIANILTTIGWIPTWTTLLVPWEDMAHTVPLAVLGRVVGDSFWAKVSRIVFMIILMIDFGSGHLYQGLISATVLAFYVPITLMLGKKFGFGTIMICHVLYDLSTVSLIKYLI